MSLLCSLMERLRWVLLRLCVRLSVRAHFCSCPYEMLTFSHVWAFFVCILGLKANLSTRERKQKPAAHCCEKNTHFLSKCFTKTSGEFKETWDVSGLSAQRCVFTLVCLLLLVAHAYTCEWCVMHISSGLNMRIGDTSPPHWVWVCVRYSGLNDHLISLPIFSDSCHQKPKSGILFHTIVSGKKRNWISFI